MSTLTTKHFSNFYSLPTAVVLGEKTNKELEFVLLAEGNEAPFSTRFRSGIGGLIGSLDLPWIRSSHSCGVEAWTTSALSSPPNANTSTPVVSVAWTYGNSNDILQLLSGRELALETWWNVANPTLSSSKSP